MKLNFEIIPGQQSGKNARLYLTPTEWDRVRHEVYRRAKGRCEACGANNRELHAHEVWGFGPKPYLAFGFIPMVRQAQNLVRIQCLCADCHEAVHIGRATLYGNRERAMKQYMRVNHVPRFVAEFALRQAMRKNKNRKAKYYVDITYIKKARLL